MYIKLCFKALKNKYYLDPRKSLQTLDLGNVIS